MARLRSPVGMNEGTVPTHAADLARHLGAKKAGRGWVARCPAHQDTSPSLSIGEGDDGRILLNCFSGCTWGEVTDALRARGLWANGDASRRIITPEQSRAAEEYRKREEQTRIADAVRLWNEAASADHALVRNYLAARKLALPAELCGNTLRFHPACPWGRNTVPCMVAAFRSIAGDIITGIHRIRLDQPERWPRAERMMLGVIAGAAVKNRVSAAIQDIRVTLTIGEGIETCMAARQLGFRSVWALGSSGGIKRFPYIDGIEELRILGERDGGANRIAADECCKRWAGRKVFHIMPPSGFDDFNDVIMRLDNDSVA